MLAASIRIQACLEADIWTVVRVMTDLVPSRKYCVRAAVALRSKIDIDNIDVI
jgi:hypothetical protein